MRILCLILLCFLSAPAQAEECLDSFYLVADQSAQWDLSRAGRLDFFLPTYSGNGPYLTAAAAHYAWKGPQLHIEFDFKLPPGQVSYPYNIYKLSVELGNEGERDYYKFELDYTNGCQQGGKGIFPGQHIEVPKVLLPPRDNGSPRGLENVRVKVWGLHF